MSTSSTLGHAASILGGWIFFGACIVGSVVYFKELREYGRWALGVPASHEVAAGPAPHTSERIESARLTERSSGSTVELRADQMGHFSTSAQVNGSTVDVMVDTGATLVALTWEDAERAGIFVRSSDFTHRANTANGVAQVAPVTIDSISIGGITVRNVRGAVMEQGKLNGTLLGMAFLGRLSRAELKRDTLILEE